MRVTTLLSLAVACQATCMRSCGRVGCARQPTYYPRSTASEVRQGAVQFGGAFGGQPVVYGGAINPPMPTGGGMWPQFPYPQFPYPQFPYPQFPYPQFPYPQPYPQPQFPYPQPGQGWPQPGWPYPQPQFPYPQPGWPYPQPQWPYPPQPQWPYPPPQPCTQACSCDNGCSMYGDCCFDYISYCVNPQAPTMAPTTMAPTTMAPTDAPTMRPTLATDAPTGRPTLATDAPTSSAPTSSAPTNQPTRPTAPPVTGGWQTVAMGLSCDTGCGASGKTCDRFEASANIAEVSSGPSVNTILVAGGVDTTGSTNFPSGSLPSVPYYDTVGKVIHFSDIPRDPNSIQCGLVPAATDIRVCYCA